MDSKAGRHMTHEFDKLYKYRQFNSPIICSSINGPPFEVLSEGKIDLLYIRDNDIVRMITLTRVRYALDANANLFACRPLDWKGIDFKIH